MVLKQAVPPATQKAGCLVEVPGGKLEVQGLPYASVPAGHGPFFGPTSSVWIDLENNERYESAQDL